MAEQDSLWFKDAVIYELHVRAFQDSTGDGVGDFAGLTQRLDYLQDLGITAIWLLPFYPSPLKDDGYDIADYTGIHAPYGTLEVFRKFLDQAHERGLRVITELVLNHTSDHHPWFRRARRSPPGSPERDFYVWSDTPNKYTEARIIFKDFEPSNWTWDPVAGAYFWHRFYSHQPDLNYDNPAVWEAVFPFVDFWFGMGVDGLRLDAVPYLFEREGTNCENLPETHAFLKALRQHVDERFPNRMLLAEANQWPEEAAAYFGSGDECHMAFHFPVMPRLFMAIHMEDRFPVLDIMAQTPAIPENCQWAVFLRNHDELTLEMVTDEERDYMYRAYAHDPQARINLGIRRRLAPLLGNDRRRVKLMNALLFSLPGTPVVYYGDEIGMGDNIYLGDRNSVRTPMQWSPDRNAGFSHANPQKLYLPAIIDPEYHYEAVNVEAQQNNANSLLWWMKRLIALRKRYHAFGRGSLEFLHPRNPKVLAFVRRHGEELILVVANLSRFVQSAELDLGEFQGLIPVELFGKARLPVIGKQPYLTMLGPHDFYWFALQAPSRPAELASPSGTEVPALPAVRVTVSWESLFRTWSRERLEAILPGYLLGRRWFSCLDRTIRSTRIVEASRVPFNDSAAYLTLIEVEFTEGPAETYALALAFTPTAEVPPLLERAPEAALARLYGDTEGILHEASADPRFCTALLEAIGAGTIVETTARGELAAFALPAFLEPSGPAAAEALPPVLHTSEAGHTSIQYGEQFLLKLFRRVDEGVNPELEVGRFLTERRSFPQAAPLAGALEYRRERESITLAVVNRFVPNQGNGWQYTLDALSRFFELVLTLPGKMAAPVPHAGTLLDLPNSNPPDEVREPLSLYLTSAQLLGERVGQMHGVLASELEDPSFSPEPFTALYQQSRYQALRGLRGRVLRQLSWQLQDLPEAVQAVAREVLAQDAEILKRARALLGRKITAARIRCHGNLHLGKVLNTGKDFLIVDFEGDAARPISERRLKRSPLRDVATVVRSFHFAAYSALFGSEFDRGSRPGVLRPEDQTVLEPWARWWCSCVSATFVRAYLGAAPQGNLLPESRADFQLLLDTLLLERALEEVLHELRHGLNRVIVPLKGLIQLLEPIPELPVPTGS